MCVCVSFAYLTIIYSIAYGVHSLSIKKWGSGTRKPKSYGPGTAKRVEELKENHTHAPLVQPLPPFSSAWISNDNLLHREKKDKRRDSELGFFPYVFYRLRQTIWGTTKRRRCGRMLLSSFTIRTLFTQMGSLVVYIKKSEVLGPEPYLGSSPFLQSFFTPLPMRKEMAESYWSEDCSRSCMAMTRNTRTLRKDLFSPMVQ